MNLLINTQIMAIINKTEASLANSVTNINTSSTLNYIILVLIIVIIIIFVKLLFPKNKK